MPNMRMVNGYNNSKMKTDEFIIRAAGLLVAEENDPITYWWLSFVGEEGSRGVCIVEARGFTSAVLKAHKLGINPGGEVAGFSFENVSVASKYIDKLLDKETAKRLAKDQKALSV